MRMSCNGCRVLRKGCADDCVIRPCLHWIPSPDAQANATLFLAKFYGRAGLLNLIIAGPPNLRPAIFRSLLYEACGRIVNPVEGSVGLLWAGEWARCEDAVDGVLRGRTAVPGVVTRERSGAAGPIASALSNPAIKAFDIRHVSRESAAGSTSSRPPPRARARSNNLRIAEHVGPYGRQPVLNVSDGRRDGDDVELDLSLGQRDPQLRLPWTGPSE